MRELEEKLKSSKSELEKEQRRRETEVAGLKERLETLRKMNFNLQRILKRNEKKAAHTDSLIKRCVELERSNRKLMQLVGKPTVELQSDSKAVDASSVVSEAELRDIVKEEHLPDYLKKYLEEDQTFEDEAPPDSEEKRQ